MPAFTLLTPSTSVGVPLGALVDHDVRLLVGDPDLVVTGVAINGAEVAPGALFAALPGQHGHGAEHWSQAAAAGAVAVLTDAAGVAVLLRREERVPVLVADDPRAVLGRVAATVHGTDRDRPMLFGVTGTNGKTSTVHMIDALLEHLGVPAGHSSTADRRSGTTVVASRLTSPEAPELHALLARMREDGLRAAALEVSAQALSRNRVDGLVFDVAGFTNLSHDHMDEYATTEQYLAAKLRLFTPEHARRGVVVLDSPAGPAVRDRALVPVTTIASDVGVGGGVAADWTVRVLDQSPSSTRFALTGPDGQRLETVVPLVGSHMALDAGLAIVMLVEAGFSFEAIANAVGERIDVVVPGRTDLLSGTDGPRVYTDFSHTPDSIEKTLAGLRAVTPGRLIVIVGADGDKDPSKREPMGRAAAEGADVVVVTDHHPRFEDPARIRRALLAGAMSVRAEGIVEAAEPAEAIRTAIRLAGRGDTVLWVGPGQTDYRVVRDQDVPYSPREDARRALAEAGWPLGR